MKKIKREIMELKLKQKVLKIEKIKTDEILFLKLKKLHRKVTKP